MTEDQNAKIRAALTQLDPSNNDHWTDDGLPKTGVVQRIAHDQTIKRQDIEAAMPGFERPTKAAQSSAQDDFGQPVEAASAETDATPAEAQSEYLSEAEIRVVLVKRVKDAKMAIIAADKKKADAENERIAAVKALRVAESDFHAQFPPMTATQNVKAHIASENARRMEQVTGQRQASQVDRAMQRGGRANVVWKRPVRGVIGADGNLIKDAAGNVAIPRAPQVRPVRPLITGAARA